MRQRPLTTALILATGIIIVSGLYSQLNSAHAQLFGMRPARLTAVSAISATVSPGAVHPGGRAVLTMRVQLSPGFHINAAQTNDPQWIPTAVSIASIPRISFGTPIYPAATRIKESYFDKPLLVYRGAPVVTVPIHAQAGARPGAYTVTASISYQGCNSKLCLPPATKTVSAVVVVK